MRITEDTRLVFCPIKLLVLKCFLKNLLQKSLLLGIRRLHLGLFNEIGVSFLNDKIVGYLDLLGLQLSSFREAIA